MFFLNMFFFLTWIKKNFFATLSIQLYQIEYDAYSWATIKYGGVAGSGMFEWV